MSRVEVGRDVSLIAKSSTRKGVIVMDTKQEKQSGQYNDTNCQKNVVWSHFTPSVYLGRKLVRFPTGGVILVWIPPAPGSLLFKIDNSWALPLGCDN